MSDNIETTDSEELLVTQPEPQQEIVEYDDPDDYVEGGDVQARYNVEPKKHGLMNLIADEVETPTDRPSTPWDLIVMTAKAMNVEIGKPKDGCKHCFGRGWVGIDALTRNPVVCQCIFPTRTPAQKEQEFNSPGMQKMAFANMSREQRRRVAKTNKKQLRKMAKDTFSPEKEDDNV